MQTPIALYVWRLVPTLLEGHGVLQPQGNAWALEENAPQKNYSCHVMFALYLRFALWCVCAWVLSISTRSSYIYTFILKDHACSHICVSLPLTPIVDCKVFILLKRCWYNSWEFYHNANRNTRISQQGRNATRFNLKLMKTNEATSGIYYWYNNELQQLHVTKGVNFSFKWH